MYMYLNYSIIHSDRILGKNALIIFPLSPSKVNLLKLVAISFNFRKKIENLLECVFSKN